MDDELATLLRLPSVVVPTSVRGDVPAADAALSLQLVASDPQPAADVCAEEGKVCKGCRCNPRVHKDFFDPAAVAPWAMSKEKGLWCRECYNVWRHMLRGTVSLSVLFTWLSKPGCFEQNGNNVPGR